MGSQVGPCEFLCDCCRTWLCSCQCPCPKSPCKKTLEEVTAEDYIDKNPKKREAKLNRDNRLKQMLRSCGGFTFGLFLTSLYALLAMFVNNYSLWYCGVATVTIGLFLSIGMAFSVKVRATVFLMLPTFLTYQGKSMVLIIAVILTIQGPVFNILENFQRSSDSISCGVELAVNQSKEALEKANRPLVSMINYLKRTARRLKAMAEKVKRFMKSVIGAVNHMGRAVRNIWRFLANMVEICNFELQEPYKRCVRIFNEAKNNCMESMGFLFFVCYIVDVFKPLCGLAKVTVVLCLVPLYVQKFAQKHIKNPTANILNNIKEQFVFNMTVLHNFNVTLNTSKSIQDIASGIMEDVHVAIKPYLEALGMLSYSMVFVSIYIYLTSLHYRRQYLLDNDFDNNYITQKFIELDVMRERQERQILLPLSSFEAYKYIRPNSLYLTRREQMGYSFEIINVCRNVLLITLVIIIDYIIFWVLDMVRYLLQGELVARAPVVYSLSLNGTGYTSDIFSNIVEAFDVLQRTNITIISKKCTIKPSEPNYRGYILIGIMFGIAFLISIFGVYIKRLQHVICAWYYPRREQERIAWLYNKLLIKRRSINRALIRRVKRNYEDEGCHYLDCWQSFLVSKSSIAWHVPRSASPATARNSYPVSPQVAKGFTALVAINYYTMRVPCAWLHWPMRKQ